MIDRLLNGKSIYLRKTALIDGGEEYVFVGVGKDKNDLHYFFMTIEAARIIFSDKLLEELFDKNKTANITTEARDEEIFVNECYDDRIGWMFKVFSDHTLFDIL